MFVVSVKAGRRQWLCVMLCALLAVFTVLAVVAAPSMELPASATVKKAETTEQRMAFLKNLGYEVGASPEEVQEIRLPDEPDETLSQYETVLQQASMSLEPYYGKRVRLYTYSILNAAEAASAHVYVYRDRIIAGDIMSERANGFCLPLVPKESK